MLGDMDEPTPEQRRITELESEVKVLRKFRLGVFSAAFLPEDTHPDNVIHWVRCAHDVEARIAAMQRLRPARKTAESGEHREGGG